MKIHLVRGKIPFKEEDSLCGLKSLEIKSKTIFFQVASCITCLKRAYVELQRPLKVIKRESPFLSDTDIKELAQAIMDRLEELNPIKDCEDSLFGDA